MRAQLYLWMILGCMVNCFQDNQTVLRYIGSGYLFQDALSPNTCQLSLDRYFSRFSEMSASEKQLVDASAVDYASVIYPKSDLTLTDSYQSIMTVFYPAYSYIYQTYYRFDNIANSFQSVTFLIDPCRNILSSSLCIEGPDVTVYSDNFQVQGAKDLHIAFFTNTTILHCSLEWQKLINCGSFIEIHRPLDPYAIQQLRIDTFSTINYTFFYFNTVKLCAGKYELWYVVRTRIGVVLQYTKPFFITYPSCDCSFELYLKNPNDCP